MYLDFCFKIATVTLQIAASTTVHQNLYIYLYLHFTPVSIIYLPAIFNKKIVLQSGISHSCSTIFLFFHTFHSQESIKQNSGRLVSGHFNNINLKYNGYPVKVPRFHKISPLLLLQVLFCQTARPNFGDKLFNAIHSGPRIVIYDALTNSAASSGQAGIDFASSLSLVQFSQFQWHSSSMPDQHIIYASNLCMCGPKQYQHISDPCSCLVSYCNNYQSRYQRNC
jgi:hypothetical protein